ncbi:oligosaccharide flippase family protein [Glaesserella parasuis]|nr:oligosaccharide flippase family protein [Glaesserella parasuis]
MKVIKDSAIYLFGELVSKSIPFLLLPYLSRKLGVEGFGELSYYQTFLALFAIFIGLSQDGAVARYFYRYGKRSLDLVVTTGYAYTITIGALGLIACWVAKSEIMFYLVLSSIFQVFLVVQLSIRQCQKQALPYTLIQLGSAITNAVFTVFMLEIYETALVEKRILAVLCSNIFIAALAYVIYKRKTVTKIFNIAQYKLALWYVIAFGFPMIFHHGSFFIKGQLDRIFIYHRFSEADLGLYAMGVQIASILSVVILAINKALVPYLFERLKQGTVTLKHLEKWAMYSLFIVPIPSLITLLIPEQLFLWLLGEQFQGVKYYVALFLLSTSLIIPYLFLVNYLFYHGKTKQISYCSVLSTGIYLIALGGLMFTEISYIPWASVLSSVIILYVLGKSSNRDFKNEKKLIIVNSMFGLVYSMILFGHKNVTFVVSDGISKKIREKLLKLGVDVFYIPYPKGILSYLKYILISSIFSFFIRYKYSECIGHDHLFISNLLAKPYVLIEDGYGNYANLGPKRGVIYSIIYRKWLGLGRSVFCKKIILTGRNIIPSDILNKVVTIPISILERPYMQRRSCIISKLFGVDHTLLDNVKFVIYTQPLYQDGFISREEHINIYLRIIRDSIRNLSVNEFILLKPHPRDSINYEELLSEYKNLLFLDKDIPSEFLGLIYPNYSFLKGISLFSSSGLGDDNHTFVASKYLDSQQIIKMKIPTDLI